MKKQLAVLFTLLILVPVVLAACGGDDKDSDGGDVSLGQSFETTQQGVTLKFNYPDGWANEEQEGSVAIGSTQSVLESLSGDSIPELGGSDAGMLLLPFPAQMLTLEGDASEVSATAAVESFGGQLLEGEGEISLGEASETTFNGKAAASATISGDANGEFFVVEASEDFFLFAIYVAGDYNDDAKAIAEGIMNSAELTVSE